MTGTWDARSRSCNIRTPNKRKPKWCCHMLRRPLLDTTRTILSCDACKPHRIIRSYRKPRPIFICPTSLQHEPCFLSRIPSSQACYDCTLAPVWTSNVTFYQTSAPANAVWLGQVCHSAEARKLTGPSLTNATSIMAWNLPS